MEDTRTLDRLERAARYRQLRIEISKQAAEQLRQLSEREKRTPHAQAAYMLEQLLLGQMGMEV